MRPQVREALLFHTLGDGRVRCELCAHGCTLAPGQRGICGVRVNLDGTLMTLVYGRLIAANVDPIEKKPLYHFLPGSRAYSVATVGCNFRCPWCQNWSISQARTDGLEVDGWDTTPESVVQAALRANCASVSFTYTEPTVFFEFAYDTAKAAHEAGLKTSFVTNGYMSAEATSLIAPYLDAANVDLKAFSDETYRTYCGARLEPVLDTLRRMKGQGIWVEVTTLLVHGINDDPDELRRVASFVATDLGVDTPWHVSRSYPAYRMGSLRPTPLERLRLAVEIGQREGLRFVYVGNVGAEMPTRCPSCQAVLIRREGFWVVENRVTPSGACPGCGTAIAGVGMAGR